MANETLNLGFTELRGLLHGVVPYCSEGTHFEYAFGKMDRRNPIQGL